MIHARIGQYEQRWSRQGYAAGIPDEVPDQLMHECLAPSYKQLAIAIMKNDHALSSLGFSVPVSPWYSVLKRIEFEQQGRPVDSRQLPLNFTEANP